MDDHAELVTEYITAVGEGRLDDLSRYLHPDVTFESPGLRRLSGAEAYVGALRQLTSILDRNEIKRVFVDGDEACVIYDFVTSTPVGALASVEWLRVQDGKIASVVLVFDNARWPEVLAALGAAASKA